MALGRPSTSLCPLIWLGQAQKDADGGGLAGPVLAQQGEDRAGGHFQGKTVEGHLRPETLRHLVKSNHWGHVHTSSLDGRQLALDQGTQLAEFEPALLCFDKDLLDAAAEKFQPLGLAAAAGPVGHGQAGAADDFAGRRRPAIADRPGRPCWD